MSRPWPIVILLLPLLTACLDLNPASDRPIPQTSTDLKPDATQPQAIAGQSATIIGTGDGDTLRVQSGGETVTVRLACIDAPETAQQPYGRQSAEHLAVFLPSGTDVTLRVVDTDRYGRTVAEVYKANESINLQMVEDGQAVVYTYYLDGCSATKDEYLEAEANARQQQIAFWSQSDPVLPWDFRRGKRDSQPEPDKLEPKPDSTGLPSCINSDCDCADFSTQAQAQQVLEMTASDPHRLDGDGDGLACERLP
ncbi:MAG: thermonuclease family protein [Elainellaceae cyanobacterium]